MNNSQHSVNVWPQQAGGAMLSESTFPNINDNNVECKDMNDEENTPKTEIMQIEGSVFKENESNWSIIWLVYTFLYWSVLTWIPILSNKDFSTNLWGFTIWCFGFIGMVSTAYTIYNGQYPSGSTKQNQYEMFGIGRWTAAILTSTVMIDCFVLVYISVDVPKDIDTADNIIYHRIYNTNLSRLIFHIVHIFWSSLFFYNRFYQTHKSLAIRAFIFEWGDIIWSCIVSFIITQPESVDVMYFLIVGIELIGWMTPMMFNKKWGTQPHAQKVASHLLILDLCTDAPIIFTLLVEQAYKGNTILWIDLIWKSFVLQRFISIYFVKNFLQYMEKRNGDTEIITESAQIRGISLEAITFVWLIFVGIYWSICVLIRCVMDNEITLNYECYTWFLGMIGIFCVYNACLAGHSAETNYGKPFIAFTCLLISTDCVIHAYILLAGIDQDDIVGETTMILHCFALISSVVFFSNSFKKGISFSFAVQWIDIILMFIVIEILNGKYHGDCFSKPLCCGYFVVFTIKIIFWFTPIIFGYANHKEGIHMHMVLLDTFTDLPLVWIIIWTHGYKVNGFVFVDIVFKVIVLLISYSYHLIINLVLARIAQRDEDDD